MLEWHGPTKAGRNASTSRAGLDPAKLPGLVADDPDAKLTGDWTHAAATGGHVGPGYLHDGNEGKGKKKATFVLAVKEAGEYDVRLAYTPNNNRATNVPVTVSGVAGGGSKTAKVNQRLTPPVEGHFVSVGVFRFEAGANATVEISNEGTDGHVIVDAVQMVPVKKG